jgi:hypothetical protein
MTITDTWGYSINGSWTGLTGFLQREEADIGSTGMFVLKQRLSVVNFIAATTRTRCSAARCPEMPPLSAARVFTYSFYETASETFYFDALFAHKKTKSLKLQKGILLNL